MLSAYLIFNLRFSPAVGLGQLFGRKETPGLIKYVPCSFVTLLFLLCFKGEADIIEGANSQGTNEVTLHTSTGEMVWYLVPVIPLGTDVFAGCTMPSSRTMTG